MPKKKVAVLGAGPMGLATGYFLAKKGFEVEIFEAGPVVGGMAASFDFDGLSIERYYHFHCLSDSGFLDLLEELGIQDKLVWRETKMGFYYKGQVHEWGNPIALLKFPHLGLIGKIRYGLMAFLSTKRSRDNWKDLDEIDALTWIKKWVGVKTYEILWGGLFNLKFHHFTNSLSAAWIWSRIRRIGQSRTNLMKECLGHLEGGSQILLDELTKAIGENGGKIYLNTNVERVVMEEGRVIGLQTEEGITKSNLVISTVPTPYLPSIMKDLSAEITDKWASIDNIAVVCLIVKLSKPLTNNFWLNVNDPDMDIPGIIEYSNLNHLPDTVVYVPYYMPGDHPKFKDNDDVFIAKVRRYLKIINPEISDDDFLSIKASRYRFAQPICDPGFQRKLPPVDLPIDGLFAADTSYYYPEDRGISESIDMAKSIADIVDKKHR